MNWQLSKITGSKETIKPKVSADAKLSQQAKDLILSEIASLPDSVSIVSVTGFSADHSNPSHKEAMTRNIQITISSASL